MHMLLIPGALIGADPAPPLPRRPARRHLAAVVAGRGRPQARRRARAERLPGVPPGPHPRAHGRGAELGGEQAHAGEPRRVQALQGGRPQGGEAVLPLRDLARHRHVARRRRRDHRPRGALEVRPQTAPTPARSGRSYADKADPATTNFVPRPDWFFYFLFYLLRIFKWPETVVLGTVGVPTILLILLIGLPFFDRRPERRSCAARSRSSTAILVVISMGTLTWKGATAKEALGSETIGLVPEWAEQAGLHRQRRRRRGREAVRRVRLPQLPHLPRHRQQQPRRARPLRGGGEGPRRPVADRPPHEPEQQDAGLADAVVRRPRRREPEAARDVPRGLEGRAASSASRHGVRRLAGAACDLRRFPASTLQRCASSSESPARPGAPYAARLLESLAAAGCEVGLVRLGRRDRGARDRALRRPGAPARRGAASASSGTRPSRSRSTGSTTARARTRAARRRSTHTSSARAR